MTTPLLSVVLPVYNVAPYLRQCLDSLVAQSRPPDEIIAVDDGATDDCPEILADYARRMPTLRIIRQVNGGLSVARNTGIAQARGKYLAFLDSDDFAAPSLYATLLDMAERENLDIALCNAWFHHEGRRPDELIYGDVLTSGVKSGSEWLGERLRSGRFLHMVWMHLYRRDFVEQRGFRFVPGLIHEDVIWTTRALLAAKRVQYTREALLHYRILQRRFSDEQNQKRLDKLVSCSEFNARTLADIARNEIQAPELRRLLEEQMVDGAFSVFHKLDQMPDRSARTNHLHRLRRENWFGLLWRHARGVRQHRRIVRQYLRSCLPLR